MRVAARRRTWLGRCAVAVVLLGGCARTVGGTGTPPPHAGALVVAMYRTMSALPGGFQVHTTASLSGPTLEGRFRLQGRSASGTYAVGAQVCELRRVGDRNYGRAPAAFWTALNVSAAGAAAVDGRWASFDDTVGLASQLQPSAYLTGYRDATDAQFEGVRAGQLDGAAVWQVRDADTSTTLSITTDRAPRLLRVATGVGTIDFSFPDGDLQVSAPSGAVPLPG